MSDARTITCEEALRLLATYLDGELDRAGHRTVEYHLTICRSCYSRAEFERRLKAECGALRQETVAPGFEERVRRLMTEF